MFNMGGGVPTRKPQVITKIWFIIIKIIFWYFYAQIFVVFGLRIGSSLLLDPTPNISPKIDVQKKIHVGIHIIVGMKDLGPVWTGPYIWTGESEK